MKTSNKMAIATKTKPKSQTYKKRTGAHHKRGKNYLKPYWPYLPLIAVVALGLVFNGILANHNRGVDGYAMNVSPASLLNETNNQRQQDNLASLSINSELAAAAQAKANDMVRKNYWSHVSPSGEQPWQFDTDHGYQYQSAGENLAYGFGSSSQILSAWMASPEHRRNILDNNYQNVGFGIANSPNFQGHGPATVVVAEYGQPLMPVITTASAENPPAVTTSAASSQPVERVQLMSGGYAYSVVLVVTIASLAALLFILRHALAFKKLLLEGEGFVLHHRYLDVLVVSLAVAGVLLTRTVGVIH